MQRRSFAGIEKNEPASLTSSCRAECCWAISALAIHQTSEELELVSSASSDSNRADEQAYDLAVIGLGLVGSAALRHAASSGANVIGIGPAEPEQWHDHTGPFSSHFDSGRVTRRLDVKPEWALLAARSIAEYRNIEQASEQRFYAECGFVFARDDANGIGKLTDVAAQLEVPLLVGPADEATAKGPCRHFNLPSHFTVLREPSSAGFVDPRRMATAQRTAAQLLGATVDRSEVVAVSPRYLPSTSTKTTASGKTHGYSISMTSGESVVANRVLYATGAYGTGIHAGLEPLALRVRPEAVTIAEVGANQVDDLADMPSIIYLLDHEELESVYVVPATRYPNGKTCIKIGPLFKTQGILETREQMTLWMQTGKHTDRSASSDEPVDFQTRQHNVLKQALIELLPDVRFVSWESKPCLITETESRLPFVDHVGDGVVVAVGGNGHAAKSSDAIGALAAGLVLNGKWTDSDLAADSFRARFGNFVAPASTSAMSRHIADPNQ